MTLDAQAKDLSHQEINCDIERRRDPYFMAASYYYTRQRLEISKGYRQISYLFENTNPASTYRFTVFAYGIAVYSSSSTVDIVTTPEEGYFLYRMTEDHDATNDVKGMDKGSKIFAANRILACSIYYTANDIYLSGIVGAAMFEEYVTYNYKIKIDKAGKPKASQCECPGEKDHMVLLLKLKTYHQKKKF
ncbi:hypothetical protein KUTeg_005707 [Tegillarca granosa]|uniref:Uncharacterized protein n=1 Tax=Tegillarca granosa TaxID=220873 RepID=A0ABQ9FHG8_TEGGR|nr:hypothetical protein KUTeg_005707 [Tegillarca granosa]